MFGLFEREDFVLPDEEELNRAKIGVLFYFLENRGLNP